MTAPRIGHKAISASAGSGKTFQLAHRYIELMALGVEPERIIALTFSRKAAGEIFDSAVGYLCRAASSPEAALRTAEMIKCPGTGQREFLLILRGLLESLHRLHIGTLDSFTVGVAKTFPLELGIPPRFQLVGEGGAEGDLRQMVLSGIFSRRDANKQARGEFLRAYRQATFGREEKGLEAQLDELIRQERGCYQLLPQVDAWGSEERIWANEPWWKQVDDVEASAERLIDLLRQDGLSEGMMQRWRAFAEAAGKFTAGSIWQSDLKYIFEKLSDNIRPLREGELTLTVDRKRQRLSGEECRLALALMAHVMRVEIDVALRRTRGIYGLLDLYERYYDDMMRGQGRMTFVDIQYLMTAGNRANGGLTLSRCSGADARLYIDYRLDCKLDHWLLDEFQDTSDLQWEVLSNLADEILQDDSGRRSLFYVGDAKQAVYGWRGGNARLFNQILDRYEGRIELGQLNTSFRSCRTVIDAVNAVFDDIPAGVLPDGTVGEWRRAWRRHECEKGAVPSNGYAAIIEPPCYDGERKPGDEDRYRIVARLLREIDPLSKGLSAAVLVRSNKSGEEIVDFLRRECGGMRVLHEGKAFIKDNPVVSVLLALVQLAAHPGDTLAWRHLEMSPLQRYFIDRGLNRENLPPLLLREMQSGGFQALIRQWGARLRAACPLDGFGMKRLSELTDAAIEFDGSGGRDCNSFLRFVDGCEVHDLAAGEAVRVMTIHQSKGLGFDVVMLPDLQSDNMTGGGRPGLILAREPGHAGSLWALHMPRRIVAGSDDVLKEQIEAADETDAFDALCLLYVAMTRAKRGLYMITSFPGKGSKILTPASFLKRQLAGDEKPVAGKPFQIGEERAVCLYETGDSQWHKGLEKPKASVTAAATQLPPDFRQRPSARRRLIRVQPAKRPEVAQRAGLLFAPDARDALEIGTAVHKLYEKVSWIDEFDIESLIAEWSATASIKEELKQKAVALFRRSLGAPEIRRILTRPDGNVSLWCEKRFEIVIGNRWVSGAFDRVVVMRDRNGKPVEAAVLDFKSDAMEDEADLAELAGQYSPQMEIYRSALSRMLGLQPSKIGLKLVFINAGMVREI